MNQDVVCTSSQMMTVWVRRSFRRTWYRRSVPSLLSGGASQRTSSSPGWMQAGRGHRMGAAGPRAVRVRGMAGGANVDVIVSSGIVISLFTTPQPVKPDAGFVREV